VDTGGTYGIALPWLDPLSTCVPRASLGWGSYNRVMLHTCSSTPCVPRVTSVHVPKTLCGLEMEFRHLQTYGCCRTDIV